MNHNNYIQLLRHATLFLNLGPWKILIDPMLAAKDSMPPVANAGNDIRIPMRELPLAEQELQRSLQDTDMVLVTHTHRDHWDIRAQELIGKDQLILCQPEDLEMFRNQGFKNVQTFENFQIEGLTIQRTSGQHGTGEIGKLMGKVSGAVITHENLSVYIAGDTIWCNDVQETIEKYQPGYVVVNAGAAQFLSGGAITMTSEDVKTTVEHAAGSKVIAVHMDTINHCLLTRRLLHEYAVSENLTSLIIPKDGEKIVL